MADVTFEDFFKAYTAGTNTSTAEVQAEVVRLREAIRVMAHRLQNELGTHDVGRILDLIDQRTTN